MLSFLFLFSLILDIFSHIFHAQYCKMIYVKTNEPPREKNQQSECAPSEDSDQPGHPPSLIRVFAVRSVGS